MSFLSNTAKKIVFWNYPRTSWQWDVLCVLILVFIFLTPKSWFQNSEFRPLRTVIIPAELVGAQGDRGTIERRARELARRPEGQVKTISPLWDSAGKLIGYEVDIR
ncbi:MAG TPA: hypothetical protein VGW32_07515 [Pyrinomonadaceae bacterium]|nr:hypothetical protein [Pyrinomonadaceae bacterium]